MAWLIGPCALLGFAAYSTALRNAPLAAVAAYPYVNTVVVVILGWLILDEPITTRLVLGAVLILVSVATVSIRGSRLRRRRPHDLVAGHRYYAR